MSRRYSALAVAAFLVAATALIAAERRVQSRSHADRKTARAEAARRTVLAYHANRPVLTEKEARRELVLEGTVSFRRAPVRETELRLGKDAGGRYPQPVVTLKTDDEGRFETTVKAGDFPLMLQCEVRGGSAYVHVARPQGERTRVDVEIRPLTYEAYRFVDETGARVAVPKGLSLYPIGPISFSTLQSGASTDEVPIEEGDLVVLYQDHIRIGISDELHHFTIPGYKPVRLSRTRRALDEWPRHEVVRLERDDDPEELAYVAHDTVTSKDDGLLLATRMGKFFGVRPFVRDKYLFFDADREVFLMTRINQRVPDIREREGSVVTIRPAPIQWGSLVLVYKSDDAVSVTGVLPKEQHPDVDSWKRVSGRDGEFTVRRLVPGKIAVRVGSEVRTITIQPGENRYAW